MKNYKLPLNHFNVHVVCVYFYMVSLREIVYILGKTTWHSQKGIVPHLQLASIYMFTSTKPVPTSSPTNNHFHKSSPTHNQHLHPHLNNTCAYILIYRWWLPISTSTYSICLYPHLHEACVHMLTYVYMQLGEYFCGNIQEQADQSLFSLMGP